jgi:signal transduction histidine kinase/predicted CoA-binding protein
MYDFLRKVPLFASLHDSDLSRLCEMVERVTLPAGQTLFEEGSRGDRAYVIESGELEVLKTSGNRAVLVVVRKSGDVIGEGALLEDTPRSATLRARTDSTLYAIDQVQFDHLLSTSPTASRMMLNTILARWRATTAALRQSEKMAQLGTLTAGVAHELNNPAAAVKRGADQLQAALGAFATAQDAVARLQLSSEQRAILDQRASDVRLRASQPEPDLDALARSDLEATLEEWLDDRSVDDAWEIAPTLVRLGYDVDSLEDFASHFAPDQLSAIASWLGNIYTAHNLLSEIGHGAGRISEIVKALKAYSYLDQAPVQIVDIHEGLDNTLMILRGKLGKVKVRRDYAPDLPRIDGYGSELNQVWTNIIDNAIDALENTPDAEIVIRTWRADDEVLVEVRDNGPGIPAEAQARVFEAFFTTKPPGKGTGLGLDISYNIVVNKHRGDIRLFSQPGRTCFTVILPVSFDASAKNPPSVEAVARPSDEQLRRILQTTHSIAVVGASSRPDRPDYTIPTYLQARGYRVIPVNPSLSEMLGEQAYPDLLAIPEPVDVVQIFRRSEDVPPIAEQAVAIGAKVIWMQEGIINEYAAELGRQAGLEVIMDTCMGATHRRLMGASAS